MFNKKKLLANLENETYCRIKKSKVHGIGVFAIKNIPKGVDPFKVTGNKPINYHTVNLSENEISGLNLEVKKLIKDFIHIDEDGKYAVPYYGFNALDISFYMNHGKNNNISVKSSAKDDYLTFYANRDINKGEELLINYEDYS